MSSPSAEEFSKKAHRRSCFKRMRGRFSPPKFVDESSAEHPVEDRNRRGEFPFPIPPDVRLTLERRDDFWSPLRVMQDISCSGLLIRDSIGQSRIRIAEVKNFENVANSLPGKGPGGSCQGAISIQETIS